MAARWVSAMQVVDGRHPANRRGQHLLAPRVEQPNPDAVLIGHDAGNRTEPQRLSRTINNFLSLLHRRHRSAASSPQLVPPERFYAPRISTRPFLRRLAGNPAAISAPHQRRGRWGSRRRSGIMKPRPRRSRVSEHAMTPQQLNTWLRSAGTGCAGRYLSMLAGYLTAIIVELCSILPDEWFSSVRARPYRLGPGHHNGRNDHGRRALQCDQRGPVRRTPPARAVVREDRR